jgi:hypothetical protein
LKIVKQETSVQQVARQKMKRTQSSETSVHIRSSQRYIPGDGNIHTYFCIVVYRTVILPVVEYGCETWSVILREEEKLRVFENRALRRIFGPKRDEVKGGWRKQHNEELHD